MAHSLFKTYDIRREEIIQKYRVYFCVKRIQRFYRNLFKKYGNTPFGRKRLAIRG
jgi:hypothetical protein